MAKFVLIDHSLRGVGGHHYEYAIHILRAAEAAGRQIILATHRDFPDSVPTPPDWRVFRLFSQDTYSPFAAVFPGAHPSSHVLDVPPDQPELRPFSITAWRRRIALRLRRRRLRKSRDLQLRQFGEACERLFETVRLEPGDHVFLPTMSDFDLLALSRYLERDPRTLSADWHVQFHFPFLDGRDEEDKRQRDRLCSVKREFDTALLRTPEHRLHFYATTEQLARQYRRLESATFRPLPYPVNRAFRPRSDHRTERGPLRVTCAGGIREEKGQHLLAALVRDLWSDCLAAGRLQLVVQSSDPSFRVSAPDRAFSTSGANRHPNERENSPIRYAPHPLGMEEYLELIRSSDVGLLLYDSDAYCARRAGVLCEFLCSGVPVVVPAGCWLADEISEPHYRYLENFAESMRGPQPWLENMSWSQHDRFLRSGADGRDVLTFGDSGECAAGELPAPEGSTELLVSLRWREPIQDGAYIRLDVEQYDSDDRSVDRSTIILSPRRTGRPILTLIRLSHGVRRLRCTWRNAYGAGPVTVRDVRMRFLSPPGEGGARPALGAVGLAAACPEQAGLLLREMADHYDHYRRTAEAFSRSYRRKHDAGRTLARLLGRRSRRRRPKSVASTPRESSVPGRPAA